MFSLPEYSNIMYNVRIALLKCSHFHLLRMVILKQSPKPTVRYSKQHEMLEVTIMEVIKYAVECSSLYNIVALFMICSLLGFIAWLCYKSVIVVTKLIQYIANKATRYNDVCTKAQYKDTLLKVDLHRQRD